MVEPTRSPTWPPGAEPVRRKNSQLLRVAARSRRTIWLKDRKSRASRSRPRRRESRRTSSEHWTPERTRVSDDSSASDTAHEPGCRRRSTHVMTGLLRVLTPGAGAIAAQHPPPWSTYASVMTSPQAPDETQTKALCHITVRAIHCAFKYKCDSLAYSSPYGKQAIRCSRSLVRSANGYRSGRARCGCHPGRGSSR